MNLKLLLLSSLICFTVFQSKATTNEEVPDSISVYIFLHESCLISQYYTLPLKELHDTYASSNIQFVGLFPNFSSKPDKIQAFQDEYDIPFLLKADYYHTKKEALGATVTPEVVVYNETEETILYRGRIDDTYARIGKRKRVTSNTELKDVLESIVNNQTISTPNTEAIGCFISKNKLP